MITQYEGRVAGREEVARELAALREQLRRRQHWLQEHAQHPPACGKARGRDCDCGLDELKGAQG